ncbi:MAG: dihydrodipicolinate synthase family protein, partial [Phototrophicaceae bacterium]
MSSITGIFNILATPFTESGALDLGSLRRLVRFQMSLGVNGLTILGVLGEAAKLDVEERRQVMDTVLETVAGAIPVVVGTSHPDSTVCIRLSNEAREAGAAGVMIAPPPLEDKSQANIIRLYTQIAEAIGDIAIVAQDFPKINNVLMPAETLAALADAVPTVRHLKLEDPPLMQKVSAIFEHTDKLQIFGGLGGMFLLEELERGTHGTMTGFAFS